ncbi:MAG: hypothetical protein R2697_08450 [Ilumatobacteraceae bacterium]
MTTSTLPGSVDREWDLLGHLPDRPVGLPAWQRRRGTSIRCTATASRSSTETGLLLVSTRNLNTLFAVDLGTGRARPGRSAVIPVHALDVVDPDGLLGDPGTDEQQALLSAPHHFVPLGDGRYSVFDNASDTERAARVIVFSVDGDVATIETVIEGRDRHNSSCAGSSQLGESEDLWVVAWGCSATGVLGHDRRRHRDRRACTDVDGTADGHHKRSTARWS